MVAASGFSRQQIPFPAKFSTFGDNRIGICPGLLRKQELNLRSSHRSFPIKEGVLRNFVNFTEKHLYWSLFSIELQAKRLKHMFSCGVDEIFKNLRTTASETGCFTWSVFLNKLHFGSHIDTWILYHHSLQFCLSILPSLLMLLILLQ